MKPLRIDHIGIAVNNLDEAMEMYKDLGFNLSGIEEVAEQKVRVAFFPCGDSEIELLESTDPEGPIAKFIEKKGAGIQHIAVRVENIEKTIAEMTEKGYKMIDEKPRYGAGGASIAFMHPKATGGVLLELSQRD